MKLTKRAEYALKAILDLALHNNQLTAVRQIADRQQIPLPFLEKILLDLRQAGLVSAQRGSRGGYRLGRPLKEISLGQLLMAINESSLLTTDTERSREWLDDILNKRIHEKINEIIFHIPLSELYYDVLSWQANQGTTFIV
jgi:Rrf2 family protein